MPVRPARICAWLSCSSLVEGDGCYCRRHARAVRRNHDEQRPPAHRRGYGGPWRRLRLLVLNHEPFCRLCGAPATEVDHIVPLRAGGTNELSNLQPLCKSCHSRKTGREKHVVS